DLSGCIFRIHELRVRVGERDPDAFLHDPVDRVAVRDRGRFREAIALDDSSPVAASNCFRTSFGSGAAPETHTRTERRSYFARFGWRRIAMYMVGTPGKRLGFVLSISLRMAPMSRGFGYRITSPPFTMERSMTAVSPYTWKRGI